MKKLIFFMFVLAISFGARVASADTVHVPLVVHYGASDFTQVFVHNLADEVVQISVSFLPDDLTQTDPSGPDSSFGATNTLASTTVKGRFLPANKTWAILTNAADFFSSTTSLKRATVKIISSGDDGGITGPIGVHVQFVHLSSAGPVGFFYPVAYNIHSWLQSQGVVGDTTMINWKQ